MAEVKKYPFPETPSLGEASSSPDTYEQKLVSGITKMEEIMRDFRDGTRDTGVIACEQPESCSLFDCKAVPPPENGCVDPDDLRRQLRLFKRLLEQFNHKTSKT